jgi:hypothetical protein
MHDPTHDRARDWAVRGGTTGDGGRRGRRIRVGLLVDPGVPTELAAALEPDLPDVLAAQVDDATEWLVSTETHEIPLDDQGLVPPESLAQEHCEGQDWDVKKASPKSFAPTSVLSTAPTSPLQDRDCDHGLLPCRPNNKTRPTSRPS